MLTLCCGFKRLVIVLFSSTLMATVAWSAAEVDLADRPLYLIGGAKPNLMLVMDDSGSMDGEMIFPTNDAVLYWNNNTFSDSNGNLWIEGGTSFRYLFPASYTNNPNNYTGHRLMNSNVLPPLDAFGFARSSDYNAIYYNPNVDYEPWPVYGDTSLNFGDSDPQNAPYDMAFTSNAFQLNLTSEVALSLSDNFDLLSGMPCEPDKYVTNPCSSNYDNATVIFYPATYWQKRTTGTYSYQESANSVSNDTEIPVAGNIIIEAEEGIAETSLDFNTISSGNLIDSASKKVWIESQVTSYDFPLNDGGYSYSFNATGEVYIWFRFYMPSESSNSLHVNLQNYTSSTIFPDDGEQWTKSNSEDWYRWRDGHPQTSSNWQWERWASVDLKGASQILRIRSREEGTGIDQILITQDSTLQPSGSLTYEQTSPPIIRDCATDIEPQYYNEFLKNREAFDGVDAIAPDGSCLERVEIKQGRAFPSGRSYEDEMQNFANWFSYYRKRHMTLRGAIGTAFEYLDDFRVGNFWINNRPEIVNMLDFDNEKGQFLETHYKYINLGVTPLRRALQHAGRQFERTDSNAPIQYACQKNSTLLFTDGYNSDGSENTFVGNADQNAGKPLEDGQIGTLADVAYYYYNRGSDNFLRPDLESKTVDGVVPVNSGCIFDGKTPNSPLLDCNRNLHMNSYTIALAAKGTIYNNVIDEHYYGKVSDFIDKPLAWPDVSKAFDPVQVDDLYHAALNGRGEIYNAARATELARELEEAVKDSLEREASASSIAFSQLSFQQGNDLYSAVINSPDWSGDLHRRTIESVNGVLQVSEGVVKASDALNKRQPSARKIFTFNRDEGRTVEFQWDNLTVLQKNDLKMSAKGVLESDDSGKLRLDYIRGVRDEEGNAFRKRKSVLGDIAHSGPLYVGAPRMGWTDSEVFSPKEQSYSGFRTNNEKRRPVIYVGANDGMLHAFDATDDGTLEELFAYIPEQAYSDKPEAGLHYLTEPGYRHRYYVDLSPSVSDVFIGRTGPSDRQWRSVLIGGYRGGGAGLFALDVTNPDSIVSNQTSAEQMTLWEYAHPELGVITERPIMAKMENGKWAVITGNGFNQDGEARNGQLFIIYLEPENGVVQARIISTGKKAGLGPATVADTDGDGLADRIYAGDMEGSMWVFDVSADQDSLWGNAFGQEPLFTAANNQPITSRPAIARHPVKTLDLTNTTANILVMFGTGRYLERDDIKDISQQAFYTIWDADKGSLTQGDLVQRSFELQDDNINQRDFVGEGLIDWLGLNGNRNYGWFVNLPDTGERQVLAPDVYGTELVIFSSMIPSNDPCDPGGTGWRNVVSIESGLNFPYAVIDTNKDDVVDENDEVFGGQALEFIPVGTSIWGGYFALQGDEQQFIIDKLLPASSPLNRRLAWEELINTEL
ncbi:MAG: PilC/PilY family type IV pilus protein [Pseudomonadota bacterium]